MAKGVSKEIGDRLKAARLAASLSQAKVAELADCTTETYARAERGETVPRTPTLRRIAEAIGVSLSDVLGNDRPSPRAIGQLKPEVRAIASELQRVDRGTLKALLLVIRLAVRGQASREPGRRQTGGNKKSE